MEKFDVLYDEGNNETEAVISDLVRRGVLTELNRG